MLTRLRPIFALFVRSLREQSRAKFTPLSRGAIALLILFFIAINERSFTSRSAPGQEVLMMLVMVNFFTIAIFGLSTFASAITEEKEDDTLGLLQMTKLNPLAILLGKSTARLCEGLLLLAVQVPFTMLCITLGGVSLQQVLRCYAILASFLFLLCNAALMWSVVCRRTKRATSMTTLTGFVLYVLPMFMIPVALGARFRGQNTATWFQSFTQSWIGINPIFGLMRSVTPRGAMPFATNSILPSLAGGVIFFGLAWLLFAPCCNSGAEAAPPRREKAASTAGRRTSRPRPGLRAIAWKDFHFLSGGLRGLVIRFISYAGIALLLVWWMVAVLHENVRTEGLGITFWIFGLMSFSIEFGLVSARMFASERKHKTLGVLYTLPIGTGRLIREKILGTLPQLIPSVALSLLGLAMMFSERNGGRLHASDGFLAGLTLTITSYVFFAVLVMYLSLRMRRAPFATGLCLMFLIYIMVGFFMSEMRSTSGNGVSQMLIISGLGWIATIALAARIPGRIAIAAAEE
ncbi:MAG: hypothetical protein ABIP20_06515 [Chthoniobacteraceae bacterium]